ncbi:MAG: carboxypeptidase regulatory-like domain-containing protein [Candidatus Limnocylindria bacterium]
MAALIMAMVAPARPASAVDSITGTVYDNDTSEFIAGVTVTAHNSAGDQIGAAATTADDGTYAIVDLVDGDYILKFSKTGYLDTWYSGWLSFDDAAGDPSSIVTVPGASGIDENLQSDAITGTVVDNDTSVEIEGATVTVYDLNEDEVGTDVTAANGTYSISVGADGAGDYVLKFSKTGYLDTWYQGYFSFDDAVNDVDGVGSVVTVPTGGNPYDENLQSDAITGAVFDNDTSVEIEGATVTVYDLNENEVGTDTTTADGTYSISLGADGAGDYVLKFSMTGYRDTWYQGYFSFDDAVNDVDGVGSEVIVPTGGNPYDERLVAALVQSITFGALDDRTLGDAPFTVSATASSGLTVVFSSTTAGICTVSAATVTLVAAGSCTVRASQAGNGTWSAAVSVDRSFAVAAPPVVEEREEETTLPEELDPSAPALVTTQPVQLPDTGLVTRPLVLVGTGAQLEIPAGITITGADGVAVPLVIDPPARRSDLPFPAYTFTTSMGTDLMFWSASASAMSHGAPGPITIRIPIRPSSADAYLAVEIDSAGALHTFPGSVTDSGTKLTFTTDHLGTFGAALSLELARLPEVTTVRSGVPVIVSGALEQSLTLASADAELAIPAGSAIGITGSAAAFAGELLPPEDAAVTAPDVVSAVMLPADGASLTFPAGTTLTLIAPNGFDPADLVAVEVRRDGSLACLSGTAVDDGVRLAVDRTGTYGLLGPDRPSVAPIDRGGAFLRPGYNARWAGQSETPSLCAGQSVDLTLRLQNTGSETWRLGTASQLVIGSAAPLGNTRDFDSGVLVAPLYNGDRYATHAEQAVAPGEFGTFDLRLRAPSAPGPYRVYLRPVIEGVAWLEDEGIYLELLAR